MGAWVFATHVVRWGAIYLIAHMVFDVALKIIEVAQ